MCLFVKSAAEDIVDRCSSDGFGWFPRVGGQNQIESFGVKVMVVWA